MMDGWMGRGRGGGFKREQFIVMGGMGSLLDQVLAESLWGLKVASAILHKRINLPRSWLKSAMIFTSPQS